MEARAGEGPRERQPRLLPPLLWRWSAAPRARADRRRRAQVGRVSPCSRAEPSRPAPICPARRRHRLRCCIALPWLGDQPERTARPARCPGRAGRPLRSRRRGQPSGRSARLVRPRHSGRRPGSSATLSHHPGDPLARIARIPQASRRSRPAASPRGAAPTPVPPIAAPCVPPPGSARCATIVRRAWIGPAPDRRIARVRTPACIPTAAIPCRTGRSCLPCGSSIVTPPPRYRPPRLRRWPSRRRRPLPRRSISTG